MSHDGRASFTTHAEDNEQETDDQGNFPSRLCLCLDRRQRGEKDQQILLLPFFPLSEFSFFYFYVPHVVPETVSSTYNPFFMFPTAIGA